MHFFEGVDCLFENWWGRFCSERDIADIFKYVLDESFYPKQLALLSR